MSEDQPSSDSGKLSWIGKLKNIFTEPVTDTRSLITLLRNAHKDQILDADGLSIIEGALQVSDMQVREIMIPRSQVVTVDVNATTEELLPIVIEAAHSRYPVIGESVDDVIGILLAKDLLPLLLQESTKNFRLKDILRQATFIPESKRLNVLLKEFRENRNHMAIVIDEYGGLSGAVTIEDVLEQIVGEIEDEFDIDEEDFIKAFDDEHYTVKALTPIEDFNEQFHSNFSSEDFDTIGGLISHRFGRIPARDDSIGIGPYIFKIISADNRQIKLIQVTTSLADIN